MPEDDQDWVRGPGALTPRKVTDSEWLELRELALTVPCPSCHVPKNVACVNRDGGPKPTVLKRSPAHHRRIYTARQATQETS